MMPARLPRMALLLLTIFASALLVLCAAAAIWLLLQPRETTFTVAAETERVTMTLNHQVPWRWNLDKVRLRQREKEEVFTGSLKLGAPVEVLIERVAMGTLWIRAEHRPAPGRAACEPGTLFGTDEEAAARTSCDVDILIPDVPARAGRGETLILMLVGRIAAGRPVGFETRGSGTALLRSGRVSMRETSIFGSNVYETGGVELDAGDFFRVKHDAAAATDNARTAEPARGFVVLDERPAMRTAFRAVGREGVVERPGGGEYPLSSPLLRRFLEDDLFQVLSALLAGFFGVITLVASIIQAWGVVREPRS
jgi:hypothetical protein